jgi:hypothetical protein
VSPYLLIVLSTGRTTYLERTLAAIDEHLRPRHSELFIFDDSVTRLGQCRAYGECWRYAAESGYEWVMVFEEDYVCLRPIDVAHMEDILRAQRHLLQLTLMRQAWLAEVPYGGYLAKDPGWYDRRSERVFVGEPVFTAEQSPHGRAIYAESFVAEWIETTRNWANAPTLFRTALAREFEWPSEPGCETTIGPRMLERYPEGKFGILGAGEVWASHIGVERAAGSHGY